MLAPLSFSSVHGDMLTRLGASSALVSWGFLEDPGYGDGRLVDECNGCPMFGLLCLFSAVRIEFVFWPLLGECDALRLPVGGGCSDCEVREELSCGAVLFPGRWDGGWT